MQPLQLTFCSLTYERLYHHQHITLISFSIIVMLSLLFPFPQFPSSSSSTFLLLLLRQILPRRQLLLKHLELISNLLLGLLLTIQPSQLLLTIRTTINYLANQPSQALKRNDTDKQSKEKVKCISYLKSMEVFYKKNFI